LPPSEIEVGREAGSHLWAKGHEARLAELRAANDEQIADEIDVSDGQPRNLTDTQPKSIEKGEDRCIRCTSVDRPVVVRQGRRDLDEPAGLRQIEEIGNAPGCHPARPQPDW